MPRGEKFAAVFTQNSPFSLPCLSSRREPSALNRVISAHFTQHALIESLLSPITAAANLTAMQDFDQDTALGLLNDVLGPNQLEVIRFIYRPMKKENEASLSLHLSKREKLDILESFYRPEVKVNVEALKRALGR